MTKKCLYCGEILIIDKFHPNKNYCNIECYKKSEQWKNIQRKSGNRPERKEYLKQYKKTEKYKQQQKEYSKTEKPKEYRKQYEKNIRSKSKSRQDYMKEYRLRKKNERIEKRKLIKYKCIECGKEFSPYTLSQKTCSKECYKKNYNNRPEVKNMKKLNAKKYQNKKRNSDITFKITGQLRHRINLVLKNKYKSEKTKILLGCEIDYFIKHIESKFDKNMNWDNYGTKGWHLDHIKPCVSFDLTNPEEQKKCFHYSNFQPLWAEDNYKKGCRERTLYGKKSKYKIKE